MEINIKDLVYSHNVNKVGFVISITEDGVFELQHPYEWSPNLTEKENNHQRLLEMSVAKYSELTKIKIN